MKYSDQIAEWLVGMNYTHCFFVGGGNIMHLTESINKRLICIPVIHEVAAGIAAEYFNQSSEKGKALALVTAGPGVTNIFTAIAGSYLESRELLVIAGQVKTSDLSRGKLRQRGIQEIDGISITQPITIKSKLLDEVINYRTFNNYLNPKAMNRKGPVFLEIPIDIQASDVFFKNYKKVNITSSNSKKISSEEINFVVKKLNESQRPALLIGGGVDRQVAKSFNNFFNNISIPILTTWNGADRITSSCKNYMGRPNTWGQRSANLIIQQTDLLIAIGTRLGLQQTGFNWKFFVPKGEVIQIDIDTAELQKKHPKILKAILGDANYFLEVLAKKKVSPHKKWLNYAKSVRRLLPLIDPLNKNRSIYISPFNFVQKLASLSRSNDLIIPCSSGGAFTVMMQIFELKNKQIMITNKGLASMGYGLSGAIGASIANKKKRTILVEGDGGFAQNIQELGTVAINNLNIKIFIFDDLGYASIRATQKNYFNGSYVGCDNKTGLGLPNWKKLFYAWKIPSLEVRNGFSDDLNFLKLFNSYGPAAFIVKIDPNQTYFPKISSRMLEDGSMESNPLHLMSPPLDDDILKKVTKYL